MAARGGGAWLIVCSDQRRPLVASLAVVAVGRGPTAVVSWCLHKRCARRRRRRKMMNSGEEKK